MSVEVCNLYCDRSNDQQVSNNHWYVQQIIILKTSKMLAAKKYWRRQNIGAYKILALPKCWRRQNIVVEKNWPRQNICVNKILASTKYWRRQNLGVDKMLAHARKHLLTVLARQSPQQLTSPWPRRCYPTSPWRCCALQVQSPSVLLPLAALLLWADSLPHCTGLFVPARHAENIGVNKISATAKISLRRPTKNWWKQKVITITVSISVHILITSKLRSSQISNAEVSECPNGVEPMGGGGRGGGDMQLSLLCQGEGWVWVNTLSICSWLWIPPPVTFSLGLSFAFLLAAVRPSLDRMLDRDDPNNLTHAASSMILLNHWRLLVSIFSVKIAALGSLKQLTGRIFKISK